MSKRKNRNKSPNIPLETLERARRQAAGEDVNAEAEAEVGDVAVVASAEKPKRGTSTPAAVRARRRKQSQSPDELTSEDIEELLLNPTKEVSEDELHEDYAYVLKDLRNMWILAVLLFVALIVLATIIV